MADDPAERVRLARDRLIAAGVAEADRTVVQVLALGYVARFFALAAVADPFRVLPHGMEGLVGLFAISWAELLTFGGASIVFLMLAPAHAVAVPVPTGALVRTAH